MILVILCFALLQSEAKGEAPIEPSLRISIVANKEIKYTQEMIDEYYAQINALERAKEKPAVIEKKVEEKKQETPKEVKPEVDLDKLAYAVAMHETKNCTVGNSASRNNCFWIMQWDKKGKRSFKSFSTKEESYEAFKTLWAKHYKWLPTKAKARRYSGNDRADIWLANVNYYYYK